MQGVKIRNDLFSPSNVKCYAVNNFAVSLNKITLTPVTQNREDAPPTTTLKHGRHQPHNHNKNFKNSIQNVRKTLGCLERSFHKSNEYEQRLLHCKTNHRHSHGVNDWWGSEQSVEKSFKCSNTTSTTNTKSTRSQDDCTDTWSTMSIICLQYQYEQLAKRYRALMKAYDEQCYAMGMRDRRLEQWRERVNATQVHLKQAHTALLTVGEKYLALKQKEKEQKKWYKDQLMGMRQSLQDMMNATTRARMKFDTRLEKCMAKECDSDAALLLYEIRKCNLLFLENMQLKVLIEQLIPGQVKWKP